MPVCGHRAGYVGLGLAQLEAQIRFDIEDSRPDPLKFSGPFQLSRALGVGHLDLAIGWPEASRSSWSDLVIVAVCMLDKVLIGC